ncbi:MAG: hypothetical protein U1B77_04640, partial [Dehalococcoidales bacterium]|nr:hypothetical protein [Dehalococcoidales bacterium]
SFDVPSPLAGGSYKVKASDGINSTEADFSIKTNASISSETGHVGSELTINGIGFTAGGVATVTYDGAQVATAPVAADGTFQASFKVPAGSAGTYSIVATDGVNTEPFTFTMESTPPSPPVPLKPEMGIKAEKETFFDWEDVEDPSGVTYTLQIATDDDFRAGSIVLEETGLTESEYTIAEENRLESVSEDEPYYWHIRAVDGAGNESEWSGTGSFYVGFSFGMGQGMKIALFVIGGLFLVVFGFWLGRKTAYF